MAKLYRFPLIGATVGLALAAGVAHLGYEEEYESRALIRVVPGSVPERFVPAGMPMDADWLVDHALQTPLSRHSVNNLLMTHDLFRPERQRMPIEDVVEILQRRVSLTKESPLTVALSFRYRDPALAQKVCRDLMTRLIDETIRERHAHAEMVVSFLKEEAHNAANEWQEATKAAASGGGERLVLERDMARRHYESLREKLAEAQLIAGLERRRQATTLEVLDLPRLPERPSGWTRIAIIALGGACGLTLGFAAALFLWLWRQQPRPAAVDIA